MTYTLVSVIVLSLVYLVIILKKYNQVTDANQPQIKQLKQQIEKLTNGIESETKLAKAVRLTVEDSKVAVSDIKMQISKCRYRPRKKSWLRKNDVRNNSRWDDTGKSSRERASDAGNHHTGCSGDRAHHQMGDREVVAGDCA